MKHSAIGLTLLAATIIYLCLHRKTKIAAILLLMTLGILIPQFIQNTSAGGAILSPRYQGAIAGGLLEKLNHLLQNMAAYLTGIIPTLLVGVFGPQVTRLLQGFGLGWAEIILKAAIVSTVFVGFLWSLRKLQLYHVYLVLFLCATLLYHNPVSGSANLRYVVPVLPFLITSLLIGGAVLARRLIGIFKTQQKGEGFSFVTLLTITAIIALISIGRDLQQGFVSPLRNRMTDLSVGTTWIATHTSSTAVVATPDPVPRYIYAQRKVLWFPSVKTPADLLTWFESEGVTHLLVSPPLRSNLDTTLDEFQMTFVVPLIRSYPERFQLEYTDERWNVKVYSIQ